MGVGEATCSGLLGLTAGAGGAGGDLGWSSLRKSLMPRLISWPESVEMEYDWPSVAELKIEPVDD